jgi:hypothetical protein
LQGLRLVHCASLVEGETSLEPVPQPRMPNKNQRGIGKLL